LHELEIGYANAAGYPSRTSSVKADPFRVAAAKVTGNGGIGFHMNQPSKLFDDQALADEVIE